MRFRNKTEQKIYNLEQIVTCFIRGLLFFCTVVNHIHNTSNHEKHIHLQIAVQIG